MGPSASLTNGNSPSFSSSDIVGFSTSRGDLFRTKSCFAAANEALFVVISERRVKLLGSHELREEFIAANQIRRKLAPVSTIAVYAVQKGLQGCYTSFSSSSL